MIGIVIGHDHRRNPESGCGNAPRRHESVEKESTQNLWTGHALQGKSFEWMAIMDIRAFMRRTNRLRTGVKAEVAKIAGYGRARRNIARRDPV
jgi:hypothetical protein